MIPSCRQASTCLLLGLATLAWACEEEIESSEGSETPGDAPSSVVVPENVRTAALRVRSQLLLEAPELNLRAAARELGWVERAWFSTLRDTCLDLSRPSEGVAPDDCLDQLDHLRYRLLVEPGWTEEALVDGTPSVATRMFDHAQLEALRHGIALDVLRETLGLLVTGPPEAHDPVRQAELLDAYGNGLIALQEERVVDLARAVRFLEDDEATALVLGEEVSAWLWLDPGSVGDLPSVDGE